LKNNLAPTLLRAHLFLRRLDALMVTAGVLLAASAATTLLVLPMVRQHAQNAGEELTRSREDTLASTRAPAPSEDEQRHREFVARLGQPGTGEQHLKTMFSLASKTGVSLQQGQYRYVFDAHGAFWRYEASFPVKASYGAIRAFTSRVLMALPFAALEELQFQRDAVEEDVVQARLRFVLYLRADGS
jgi:hypothetical protein